MTAAKGQSSFLSTELKLRIVSAVVLGTAVLFMTWIGGQTFDLLCAVAGVAILWEFSGITKQEMPQTTKLAAFAFLMLSIAAWMIGNHGTALMIAAGGSLLLLLWERITNQTHWAAIGLIYAITPFFAMSALRGETHEGLLLIFILFATVWGADIFAYFFGKGIGGPKLAPRISPKKTWAGFIGSLFGAMLVSWLIVFLFGYSPGFTFFVIVLFLAMASQIGDLFESVLKRKFDVKDSGNLIPGHGGVLDRIDGLVFSCVLLWITLMLIDGKDYLGTDLAKHFHNAFLSP